LATFENANKLRTYIQPNGPKLHSIKTSNRFGLLFIPATNNHNKFLHKL